MRPGSTIRYRCFGGHVRTVRVENVEADIKNGRPGFDGVIISSTDRNDRPGDDVWGYTDQVL